MKTKTQIKYRIIYSLLFVGLLFSYTGCTPTDDPEGGTKITKKDLDSTNDLLASLSPFNQPEESANKLVDEGTPKRDDVDTSLECVVKNYKVAPGFSEMILLDPTSDVIYPGAMLKGESIPTGEYIGINGGRSPITLSVSLENLNGTPATTIENPTLDKVREGVKDMLQQGVTGSTPAKVVFTSEEVYSEEHLSVALGASYSKGKNSVSASFDFSKSKKKYRYVIKYLQVYYTIDLTISDTDNPGSFFTEVPNINSTSPVIVSSVKYGRMLLYTVETDSEITHAHAAFDAAFKGGTAGADGKYSSFWESSIIKATIIGGSGGDAAKVVEGPKGAFNYITSGGNYSADSPGLPLGYTLRYIKNDFPIAKVVLSSEYAIRSCDLAYPRFRVELIKIRVRETPGGIEGKNLELFGNVKGRLYSESKGDYIKETIDGKKVDKAAAWSRTEKNRLKLEGHHHIYKVAEFEMYRPNYDEDYVYLSGSLTDIDTKNDDYLGFREAEVLLKDIPYHLPGNKDKIFSDDKREFNYRLDFDEKDKHEVRAYFAVTRLK